MINGEQHTIRYHVDDVLSSHMHPEVNDEFLKWLNKKYGSYGEVKAKRGDVHDYLGMKLDFREKGKVKIDMTDYVKEMVDSFPKKFYTKDTAPTPATKDLFAVGNEKPLHQRIRRKPSTPMWQRDYLCPRELDLIYSQQMHFYAQEYRIPMKETGRS